MSAAHLDVPPRDGDALPDRRPVGVTIAALRGDLSRTSADERTAAVAEAAYLHGGWAVLDDWSPSEDELADRLERAWEAADEVHARWQRALRVLPHLSPGRAKALWPRLLTVVSWLPAPDRDALRSYLTTDRPLKVLAAWQRMPEHVFCELLEATTETLLGPVSTEDGPKSLTEILTRTARRLDRRLPMALPRGTKSACRPAFRRALIPAESAAIGGGGGRADRGGPSRSPQAGSPQPAAKALRVPAGPPAPALTRPGVPGPSKQATSHTTRGGSAHG